MGLVIRHMVHRPISARFPGSDAMSAAGTWLRMWTEPPSCAWSYQLDGLAASQAILLSLQVLATSSQAASCAACARSSLNAAREPYRVPVRGSRYLAGSPLMEHMPYFDSSSGG
eukprot:CAMPEP_0174743350 /NCGR_PEP_ID=MMETSP1094-20130205/81402_1 /TAXON_ID=156173 /ORGANISM="Chrysochromulina brevifilum, Strain UTEX LB 985" /LENGTH=113 /DNA_ID=CAMNT_0015947555 /DNA_START=122 /DNA_END=464 /DNA_ORIENTATION=-